MKQSVRPLLTTLAILFCITSVWGGPAEGRKKKRAKPPRQAPALGGIAGEVAKELKLDEALVKKIAEAQKANAAAVKAWKADPAKGGKLAELGKQLRSPEVKADRAKAKEIRAQMEVLAKEQRALAARHDKALQALLTPDQRIKWQAAMLYRSVASRMKQTTLTEEQQAKARTLCAAAAKKIAGLPAGDGKAKGAALRELQQAVLALLTPEQKEKMKAARQPKEKPERPSGKKERRPPRDKKRGPEKGPDSEGE